jgi:hypothetical protein
VELPHASDKCMYKQTGTNHLKRSQIKTDEERVRGIYASDNANTKKKGTNHQKNDQVEADQKKKRVWDLASPVLLFPEATILGQ